MVPRVEARVPLLAPVTQPDYDWQLPHLECMDAHWFQQISTARVLQDLAESNERQPKQTLTLGCSCV